MLELFEELVDKLKTLNSLAEFNSDPETLISVKAQDFSTFPQGARELLTRIERLCFLVLTKPQGTVNFYYLNKLKQLGFKVAMHHLNNDGQRAGCLYTEKGIIIFNSNNSPTPPPELLKRYLFRELY